MNKIKESSTPGEYLHICPGCESIHRIPTHNKKKPNWTFSGNLERPTFSPSVNISWQLESGLKRCHYFIREGIIIYDNDSTHKLRGTSVALPNWEDK